MAGHTRRATLRQLHDLSETSIAPSHSTNFELSDLEDPTYVPGDSDETDPLIQNGRLDVNCFNSDYELASRGEDAIGENDHVIASGINGTPDTSTSNGAMAVLTSSKETRQNGHSVDAADIFDNVNAGEQIQSLDPAGPQNLEGFDATVGEISWEDGDDTHPDESAMIGATELSTSFSGKRSRQTDATESLANESGKLAASSARHPCANYLSRPQASSHLNRQLSNSSRTASSLRIR